MKGMQSSLDNTYLGEVTLTPPAIHFCSNQSASLTSAAESTREINTSLLL